ncbi:MAG: hypothetical protein HFG09_05115 [Oscillibacter sp.]|nr:hypothetical protein [Oscillibacter sp.]
MRDTMRRILARYGQEVTLRTAEGETEARAFLQPVRERGETAPGTVTELGWIDRRLWKYLGAEALSPGDTVAWRGLRFRVRSSRPCCLGEELNHWWAMLEPEREGA